MSARERLVESLRQNALVIGEVTLTSGRKAQYYVDAKRAILLPDPFAALGGAPYVALTTIDDVYPGRPDR